MIAIERKSGGDTSKAREREGEIVVTSSTKVVGLEDLRTLSIADLIVPSLSISTPNDHRIVSSEPIWRGE